jgi:hypothetical protein
LELDIAAGRRLEEAAVQSTQIGAVNRAERHFSVGGWDREVEGEVESSAAIWGRRTHIDRNISVGYLATTKRFRHGRPRRSAPGSRFSRRLP